MKIHWRKQAVSDLQQVENYILQEFGEKACQEYIDEVDRTVGALSELPNMGRLDPLFTNRSKAYRSIVIRRLSKIVYYVENDTVHVAALWDTRREPKTQADKLK